MKKVYTVQNKIVNNKMYLIFFVSECYKTNN